MRALVPILLATLLSTPGSPQAEPRYEDEAVDLLQRYLQVDTTVPPGNELKAALFFKEVLEREGIAVEVDEFAPGRANLIAVLRGTGKLRPLILANHMDVVPADPARWKVAPFAGARRDGIIWGRGAEDMKTEAILQLLALVRAKREGAKLDRDLVFLATADEEVGFAGALRALRPEGWRSRIEKAEFLITEGGENILDDKGQPVYFGVATGEKGPFWLTLKTTGTPGHGSRPIEDSALNRLVRALDRVREHRTPLKVLPAVAKFFRDQAPRVAEPRAGWYRDLDKAIQDEEAARVLYDDREVSALLRNTISITIVRAGYKTNVIPGTAEAELDVRLLPGEDPDAFLAELRGVINDPSVEIVTPPDFRRPNASSPESALFHTIERVLARHYPGVPVTTTMLAGATESVLYRPLGISAYGFTPLLTTSAEIATAHGDDERIQEATVRKSVGVFYDVVREASTARLDARGVPAGAALLGRERVSSTRRLASDSSVRVWKSPRRASICCHSRSDSGASDTMRWVDWSRKRVARPNPRPST
jgi:acetylornithine deacetylase/succinyl-diaminopimelate desuccinylase-like protein